MWRPAHTYSEHLIQMQLACVVVYCSRVQVCMAQHHLVSAERSTAEGSCCIRWNIALSTGKLVEWHTYI